VILLAACKPQWVLQTNGEDKADTTSADADTDADTDSDVDADTDADADTDTDADTDPTTIDGLDCDADYPTPVPGTDGLGACVTATIACGDEVYGTLAGGSTTYDYAFWDYQGELGSLFGDTTALDGEERVYVLQGLGQDQHATITIDTCFDSWANWIRYGDIDGAFCSTNEYLSCSVFEDHAGDTWTTERMNLSSSTYDYEFIVEGMHGATGNYRITVDCF
jgi:hypothetical protein